MKEQKIYIPRSTAKEIKFQNGGSMIKLGFHADSLVDFIKGHANEKGYINIIVSARREVGQHGDTHCVSLDTWRPDASRGGQQQQRPAQASAKPPQSKPQSHSAEPDEQDDVPF